MSVLVVYEYDPSFTPMVDHFTAYKANGTHVEFSFGIPSNLDSWTFSMRGNVVAIAASSTIKTVRIYNATTGGVTAVSATMAAVMQSVAVGDGVVYALDTGGNIYELDIVTAGLNQTIPTPLSATLSAITCDEEGNLYLFAPGDIFNPSPVYKWDGSSWTLILREPLLTQNLGSNMHGLYAQTGVLALQVYDASGFAPFRDQFYIAVSRVGIVEPTLDQVVRRLCLRTGLLTDDDIDVTDLSHDVAIADGLVRAMAISQVSTTRATLETLMAAYLFECVEGETLKFVRRGGSSVVTIPYEDLAASQDGQAEPLPLKRMNDIEVAARVSVKFANVLNDFQDGLEAADRLVTESTAEQVVEVPLGFQPSEAKKLADANTLDLAVSLIQLGPVALPRSYSYLEPTDVITVTDQYGDTFRARIVKGTIGGGVNAFELVLDDATVINSAAETDEDYVSSTLVRLLSTTDLEELDIPILRDADDSLGPYLAVSAGAHWSGAKAYRSVDDTAYDEVATFTAKTAIGTASTTLGDYTGTGFDEVNTVTVSVGDSTLSSFSRDDVLAGTADGYLIGSEIMYACTATLVSPGIYTLTQFLRGLRGTEQNIATHGLNERVVLLQLSGAGLSKVTDTLPDVNVPRYYKGVTIGTSIADVSGEAFTDTGIAKKPFAVADMRVDYTDPANPVLTWNRRSRLASSLFGLPLPLGEDVERYELEVYDSGDVLYDKRDGFDPSTAARATAQGILGLAGVGFSQLSSVGSSGPAPTLFCP